MSDSFFLHLISSVFFLFSIIIINYYAFYSLKNTFVRIYYIIIVFILESKNNAHRYEDTITHKSGDLINV